MTEMSKVRKNITVSEDLFDAFMSLKREGETQGMLLQRVIMDEEHMTSGDVTEMSKVRKNITVYEDMFDAFMSLKREGETQGMLLQRVINSMHSLDAIKSDNAALISDLVDLEEAIDAMCFRACVCRRNRISRRKRSRSEF